MKRFCTETLRSQFICNDLLRNCQGIYFRLSVSPDRRKNEAPLCVLCASVVRTDFRLPMP